MMMMYDCNYVSHGILVFYGCILVFCMCMCVYGWYKFIDHIVGIY